jgi:FkbM family methyltransferase
LSNVIDDDRVSRAYLEDVSNSGTKAVPWGDNKILCRVLGAFHMFVDDRDETIAPHLAMSGYWESWITIAVKKFLKPGMKAINVGANVGYFTLVMCQRVGEKGKVFSFECNPRICGILESNVNLNGFSNRCKVLNLAASSRFEELWFTSTPSMPGSGHVVRGSSNAGWDSYKVCGEKIDHLVEIGEVEGPIDLIMVDAEGHEPEVIAGAKETIRKSPNINILLEWSPDTYEDNKAFAAELFEMGFSASLVDGFGALNKISLRQLQGISKQEMVWFKRASK